MKRVSCPVVGRWCWITWELSCGGEVVVDSMGVVLWWWIAWELSYGWEVGVDSVGVVLLWGGGG